MRIPLKKKKYKVLFPLDFQSMNPSGRGRGHGRGRGVLDEGTCGRFLSWTVPGNWPVSWPIGQRRCDRLLVAGQEITLAA